MALIKCSKCGKEISDKANKCPSCGEDFRKKSEEKVEKPKREKSEYWFLTVMSVIASIFLTDFLFIPIEESLHTTISIIVVIVHSVLLTISILSIKKKITQKKIGVIFGWVGCIVSGLNIVVFLIVLLA